MKKRIAEMSVFELILCVFVILIHLLSEGLEGYDKGSASSLVCLFVTKTISFVVPAFIFTSGLKLFYKYETKSINYPSFIIRRTTKIYFPYIFWVIIYYVIYVFMLKFFDFDYKQLFHYVMIGDLAAPFYFVVVIMQFYLLMPLWTMYCRTFDSLAGMGLAVIITLLSRLYLCNYIYVDRIFTSYFIYWIMGCYIGLWYNDLIYKLQSFRFFIYLAAIAFGIAYNVMSYFEFMTDFFSVTIEIVKVCYNISMIFAVYTLMSLTAPHMKLRITKKLAPTTYYVFLIHCLIIMVLNDYMNQINLTDISTRLAWRSGIVYISAFGLSFIYVVIKKICRRS